MTANSVLLKIILLATAGVCVWVCFKNNARNASSYSSEKIQNNYGIGPSNSLGKKISVGLLSSAQQLYHPPKVDHSKGYVSKEMQSMISASDMMSVDEKPNEHLRRRQDKHAAHAAKGHEHASFVWHPFRKTELAANKDNESEADVVEPEIRTGSAIHSSQNVVHMALVENGRERTLTKNDDTVLLKQRSEAFRIAMLVLLSLLIAMEFLILTLVLLHRKNDIIRLSQGSILALLMLAAIAATGSCYFFEFNHTAFCTFRQSIVLIALTLLASTMVGRLWRINTIMNGGLQIKCENSREEMATKANSVILRSLRILSCWDKRCFISCGCISSPDLQNSAWRGGFGRKCRLRETATLRQVLRIIFALVAPQCVLQVFIVSFRSTKWVQPSDKAVALSKGLCYTNPDATMLLSAGIVLAIIPFTLTLFLAWQGRKLPSLFNESNQIFACGRIALLVLLVLAPLLGITHSQVIVALDIKAYLFTAIILSLVLPPCWFIVVPKLHLVLKGEKVEVTDALFKSLRKLRCTQSSDTEIMSHQPTEAMSHQPPSPRLRTVIDFDTEASLRCSLRNCASTSSSNSKHSELDWITDNLDAKTSRPQTLDNEVSRLQDLKSYLLLNSEPEEKIERITALASRMFDVPIALVSLVDVGRQWFMSNRGLGDVRETPRKIAFCAHAIQSTEDLFIVNDAARDPRFMDSPLVTGPPHIRFYAGAPLTSSNGHTLGMLCVKDVKSRPKGLTLKEKQNLRELAALLMDSIEERLRNKLSSARENGNIVASKGHNISKSTHGISSQLPVLKSGRLDWKQKTAIEEMQECIEITYHSFDQVITAPTTSQVKSVDAPTSSYGNEQPQPGCTRLLEEVKEKHELVTVSELVDKLWDEIDMWPKKVPLIISQDTNVPEKFVSDYLKIFRSAVNLMTNALERTQLGSVHFRICIKNEGSSKEVIVFECEDTGPILNATGFKSLFEASNKSDNNSSNLGLLSLAECISGLGGRYGVFVTEHKRSSSPAPFLREGAVFWFSVPVKHPILSASMEPDHQFQNSIAIEGSATQSVPVVNASESHGLQRASTQRLSDMQRATTAIGGFEYGCNSLLHGSAHSLGGRIRRALVIDDSVVVRKMIDRVMAKAGFAVTHAANGMQGLNAMKSNLFDIVFCDFLMPVLDGADCLMQYREWEYSHRPWFWQYVVGISGHVIAKTLMASNVGSIMDCFLPKPLTLVVLEEIATSAEVKSASEILDREWTTIVSRDAQLSNKVMTKEIETKEGNATSKRGGLSFSVASRGPCEGFDCEVGAAFSKSPSYLKRGPGVTTRHRLSLPAAA